MKKYDLLILNNCPSFYKINLYNEIAKRCNIYVTFLAFTDQVIITDDYKKKIKFDYAIINEKHIEERSRWKSFFTLLKLCIKVKHKKIIFGGYDNIELILLMFLLPKRKNALQCESSIKDSNLSGSKKIIKKIIFSRIKIALPSGKLHSSLFHKIGFKGICIETKGVGIFDKKNKDANRTIERRTELKYLFIGRLIPVKNIELLISVFNKNGKYLTVVGKGFLKNKLRSAANPNIHFIDFVENESIGEIYRQHDVFILPSIKEPWGLVVEEAIYWGLPVIVSEAVGSQIELIQEPQNGIIFSLTEEHGLSSAINKIEENYNYYKANVDKYDFETRDQIQIASYLKIIDL